MWKLTEANLNTQMNEIIIQPSMDRRDSSSQLISLLPISERILSLDQPADKLFKSDLHE